MSRIILILITFLIFSCNKDNNDEINPRNNINQILGTWQPIQFVVECDNGSQTIYDYNDCVNAGFWEFENNQNFQVNDKQFTSNGSCITFNFSGQWGINIDTLYLQIEDNTIEYLILDITASELKLGVNLYTDKSCGTKTDIFSDYYLLQCVNNCL